MHCFAFLHKTNDYVSINQYVSNNLTRDQHEETWFKYWVGTSMDSIQFVFCIEWVKRTAENVGNGKTRMQFVAQILT